MGGILKYYIRDVTATNRAHVLATVKSLAQVVDAKIDGTPPTLMIAYSGDSPTREQVGDAVRKAGARILVSKYFYKTPLELSQLKGIQDVTVDCYQGLDHLPEGWEELPIERLTLSNWKDALPKGLAQMHTLRGLCLQKWTGERLEEAYACPHLEELEIRCPTSQTTAKSSTKVLEHPPVSAVSLQSVVLRGLPLGEVPPWLKEGPLRYVCLVECGIKNIPSWLTALPHLEELDLSNNPIKTLPEVTAPLKKLRLAGTKVTSLPASLEHLELQELILEDTPLVEAPTWLASFRGTCTVPNALKEDLARVRRGEPLPEAITSPVAEPASEGPPWVREIAELSNALHKALPKQRQMAIYLLEPCGPVRGQSRIGGWPTCIERASCPRGSEGQPMTHLFTLDFSQFPELGYRQPGAAAASVFLSNPGLNKAHAPGSGHSAVVFTAAGALKASPAAGTPLPELPESGFRVFRVLVPQAAFSSKVAKTASEVHSALRRALHRAPARMLGPPLWIQKPQAEGDVLLQCTEDFVDANFGDQGSLYVFPDDAFWQCA